jgi:prefoldin subunit 5
MSREQELDSLRNEAEAIKEELDQIDARMKELETD